MPRFPRMNFLTTTRYYSSRRSPMSTSSILPTTSLIPFERLMGKPWLPISSRGWTTRSPAKGRRRKSVRSSTPTPFSCHFSVWPSCPRWTRTSSACPTTRPRWRLSYSPRVPSTHFPRQTTSMSASSSTTAPATAPASWSRIHFSGKAKSNYRGTPSSTRWANFPSPGAQHGARHAGTTRGFASPMLPRYLPPRPKSRRLKSRLPLARAEFPRRWRAWSEPWWPWRSFSASPRWWFWSGACDSSARSD